MSKKSGIYKLYFNSSDLVYIGQSVDMDRRYTQHIATLKSGTHHNYKMQNHYNKYNELPTKVVLQECEPEYLNINEIHWIQELDSYNNGFNLTPGGIGDETFIKGHHFNSKYPLETYVSILLFLANNNSITNKEVAKIFNVHKRVVDSITCLSNHTYLKDMYPEEVNKMLSSRSNSTRYIKSPEGLVYAIKRGQGNKFAAEHGLDGNSLNSVLRGDLKSTAGWVRYDSI